MSISCPNFGNHAENRLIPPIPHPVPYYSCRRITLQIIIFKKAAQKHSGTSQALAQHQSAGYPDRRSRSQLVQINVGLFKEVFLLNLELSVTNSERHDWKPVGSRVAGEDVTLLGLVVCSTWDGVVDSLTGSIRNQCKGGSSVNDGGVA